MRNKFFTAIKALFLILAILFVSAAAEAKVDVNVSVSLPPLVIPALPGLIVIPGTYVYYPPDVDMDIFFYRGYWYRPYEGAWYRARNYNGPWNSIVIKRVPRAVLGVPPGFRHERINERLQHRDVMRNWRGWERDRRWDKGMHRGEMHEGGFGPAREGGRHGR